MEVFLRVNHVFIRKTSLFSSDSVPLLGLDYLAVEKSTKFLGIYLSIKTGLLSLDLIALDVGEQLW